MKTESIDGKKNKDQKVKLLFGLFLIIHIIFAVYLGMHKINYHYDERLTFGLANNTMRGVKIEYGKVYQGFSLYNDYLSVKNAERFDYKGVWENQAGDVHPPFYYVIIHTICSFFPEKYSKWFGIVPNIIFMLLTDILLCQLAGNVLKDNRLALIAVVVSGTTTLAMNMVIFIRMYAMLAVFVVGISLVFAVYYNRKLDWKFYAGCYLFAVGGIMTQYYFLIYLFFLCLFFGIRLFIQKKWREMTGFIAVFLVAGGSCVLIFPAMIKQIFGGSKRGKQAFEAVRTLEGYGQYLKEYCKILNDDMFGGQSVVLILAAILLTALVVYKKGWKNSIQKLNTSAVMLLFAGSLYILIIAKIAPYRTIRYIMPFAWIYILFIVWFFGKGITVIFNGRNKIWVYNGIFVFLMLLSVNSLRLSGWHYQYEYLGSQQIFDIVHKYKDCPVICVYKIRSRTVCNAEELKEYKNYVFVQKKELGDMIEKKDPQKMILYVINRKDEEKIIEMILEAGSHLEHADYLFHSGYANVYYLE